MKLLLCCRAVDGCELHPSVFRDEDEAWALTPDKSLNLCLVAVRFEEDHGSSGFHFRAEEDSDVRHQTHAKEAAEQGGGDPGLLGGTFHPLE